MALQLAKLAGAKTIMIGAKPDAERLQFAKDLGADEVFNAEQVGHGVEAATDVFKGEGADLVIECSLSTALVLSPMPG
jgi:threonine dehydrogenase-like Zn-dependent dehydrogenase